MKTIDFRALQIHLDKKSVVPLYFLYGNENYLLDEAVHLIKKTVLQNVLIDFNYDSFYAPESNVTHVKDVVETLPAMSPRRLVVYKNVHLLKDKDWEALNSLIENPVETTTLVLVADKIDKRKKFFKKISKKACGVELNRPYENKMPQWISYMGEQLSLNISRDVAALILQLVGPNLSEIHSEVKKLKNYCKDGQAVLVEDVLKVVSRVRVFNVFDLANAIGANDRAKALQCLVQLLDQGQSPVGALSLIARHIRILSQLKEGIHRGLKSAQLCQSAGIPNYFLNDYLSQCRLWSNEKIRVTLKALYHTDKALKSSPLSSSIWLENFVLMVCRAKEQSVSTSLNSLTPIVY